MAKINEYIMNTSIHHQTGADPLNKLLPLGREVVLGPPKETVKNGADICPVCVINYQCLDPLAFGQRVLVDQRSPLMAIMELHWFILVRIHSSQQD